MRVFSNILFAELASIAQVVADESQYFVSDHDEEIRQLARSDGSTSHIWESFTNDETMQLQFYKDGLNVCVSKSCQDCHPQDHGVQTCLYGQQQEIVCVHCPDLSGGCGGEVVLNLHEKFSATQSVQPSDGGPPPEQHLLKKNLEQNFRVLSEMRGNFLYIDPNFFKKSCQNRPKCRQNAVKI